MSRWGPMVGRSGEVVQSGVSPRRMGAPERHGPRGALYRGIVLHTFATNDPVRTQDGRESTTRIVDVECDVLLAKSFILMRRVPVEQENHGLSNLHNVYVPRPCTRVITEGGRTDPTRELNMQRVSSRGVPQSLPPSLADLDGDHVYIAFVEGDLEKPVIVGAATHARARRLVVMGNGWRETGPGAALGQVGENEFYSYHQGSEIRINEQGDMLFDAQGATTDVEQETPTNNTGQIRFRVKDGVRFTVQVGNTDVLEVWKDGAQVRIDLGEGATERLILGDGWRSFFNDFLTYVFKEHQHLAGTLTTPVGGGAVTGLSGAVSPVTIPPLVPPPPFSYTGTQMSDQLLSDLAKTKKS